MNNMVNKAQGFGLSILTKIAGSEVLDQLKLRKFLEKSLYQSSKAGFRTLSQTQKFLKSGSKIQKQRPILRMRLLVNHRHATSTVTLPALLEKKAMNRLPQFSK